MEIYKKLDLIFETLSGLLWGTPLVALLLGGGIFFALYSRMVPILYFKHAIQILLGKYDSNDDPGQITHFEALSSALAGTVGMGNIAGVAVAIHTGGPGAIFWMWITAILGMSTKFFTCTLAVMYRGHDDKGEIQGGVMYFIEKGLGKQYRPLALMFSISGLFGSIVFFQANQLSQIIRDYIYLPAGIFQNNPSSGNLVSGIVVATIVGAVIFGGIHRIAKVASRLVPFMVGLYLIAAFIIIANNVVKVPVIFSLIIRDAFSGNAVMGGAFGSMIIIGVQRGLFSNEAGTGTETMAHGAAKTKEPVREGLVAMLGPFIDTIIVCSITAFIILISGVNQEREQCGAPVAPHDGSNPATWEYNDASGEITLTGLGAYLGLPKAVNAGELPNVDVPESVTYNVIMDGDMMTVVVEADTGVFWTYKLVSQDQDTSLSGTWMLSPEAGTIQVGPTAGSGEWWSNIEEDVTTRACFFDDHYVFNVDGSFQNVQGDETWIEGWQVDLNGVSLTAAAFEKELGLFGEIFLTIAVLTFALSTMFSYSYYGRKCVSYTFGTSAKNIYNWIYVFMIVIASVSSIDIAINFVDSAYALMVIPTMIGTLLLSPKVIAEAKRYFSQL